MDKGRDGPSSSTEVVVEPVGGETALYVWTVVKRARTHWEGCGALFVVGCLCVKGVFSGMCVCACRRRRNKVVCTVVVGREEPFHSGCEREMGRRRVGEGEERVGSLGVYVQIPCFSDG